MSDSTDGSATTPGTGKKPKKAKKPPFTFTDDGCRTEIRAGVLLILMAIFFWLWAGPKISCLLFAFGLPLVLIGVPLQAFDTRRRGRPGYPLKLGLFLTIGGGLMVPDLLYREVVGGSIGLQEVAPMILSAGVWMLLWWPVARRRAAVPEGAPA